MERDDELLSVRQVAELLKVSPLTVKRYIYGGKLRALKTPGGQHRIRRGDLVGMLGGSRVVKSSWEGLDEEKEKLEKALSQMKGEILEAVQIQFERLRAELSTGGAGRELPKPDIKILGIGCNSCDKLANLTVEVVSELGFPEVEITRLKEVEELLRYGPLSTPALIINNKVLVSGRIPSKSRLLAVLKGELN